MAIYSDSKQCKYGHHRETGTCAEGAPWVPSLLGCHVEPIRHTCARTLCRDRRNKGPQKPSKGLVLYTFTEGIVRSLLVGRKYPSLG
eukprot:1194800-Prorocentrum_minimum.AAC.3